MKNNKNCLALVPFQYKYNINNDSIKLYSNVLEIKSLLKSLIEKDIDAIKSADEFSTKYLLKSHFAIRCINRTVAENI